MRQPSGRVTPGKLTRGTIIRYVPSVPRTTDQDSPARRLRLVQRVRATSKRSALLVRADGETLTVAGQALLNQLQEEMARETPMTDVLFTAFMRQLRREDETPDGDAA